MRCALTGGTPLAFLCRVPLITLLEETTVSHSIAIPRHRPAERERGRHHHLFVGAILCLILGALSFGIVATTVSIVRSAASEEAAAAAPRVAYPARELPREWRLERKAVDFEHMYRQKQSPQLDWIRE
jgi:hypothetical protein